jgi:hypothetical protein
LQVSAITVFGGAAAAVEVVNGGEVFGDGHAGSK